MSDRYFEDFKVGDRFESGGMTITEAAIIDFARQWDPQPFHIDAEFAKTWTYGGLIASAVFAFSALLGRNDGKLPAAIPRPIPTTKHPAANEAIHHRNRLRSSRSLSEIFSGVGLDMASTSRIKRGKANSEHQFTIWHIRRPNNICRCFSLRLCASAPLR